MDQSAYQSETGGLYGLMILISTLENLTQTTGKPITIACDGKSALTKTLYTHKERFNTTNKCFDLISRLNDIRDKIKTPLNPNHVQGHQDETKENLTILEEWNVQMDAVANQLILEAQRQNFTAPTTLPSSKHGTILLQYKNQQITLQLDKMLHIKISQEDAIQWWIEKDRITPESEILIDWHLSKAVMQKAPRTIKTFITKWVTNQLPVGVLQVIRNFQSSATCLRCGYEYEDNRHILDCPQDEARSLWNQSIRSFDQWLQKIGTDPNIIRAFSLSINKWHSQFIDKDYCPAFVSPQVKKAMKEQGIISWDNFITGFWSTSWAEIQDVYYKTKRKRNSGHRWAVKVSSRLWTILKNQWDHRNLTKHRHHTNNNHQGRTALLAACQLELDLGL